MGVNKVLGIGFVKYFLNQNYQVFGGVRNIKNFNKDLLNNKNLIVIQVDVADDESIQAAYAGVSSKIKSLDFLINNAGLNKDSATDNHKELVCNLKSLDRNSLLNQ